MLAAQFTNILRKWQALGTRLHLIVDWFHWKLHTKKEGNCSGRSRVRRILLTYIQMLLIEFLEVICSMSKNFAFFQKLPDKFFYKFDNSEINRREIFPASFKNIENREGFQIGPQIQPIFPPNFVFTSERPHYSLALFSSFIYTCTFSKKREFASKRTLG